MLIPKRDPIFPAFQRKVAACMDSLVGLVQPHKHAPGPFSSSRVTHERPFLDGSARLGGVTVGITFSELHTIRPNTGIELIQVVDFDGNTNLESVLWRRWLLKWLRIELQGPALNTRVTGGGLPIDLRLFGLAATGDAVDRKAHEAVSYTVEAKVHASDLVFLVGSGTAAAIAGMMGTGVTGQVAQYIVLGCSYAIPVVGGLIALSSLRWMEKVLASKTTPASMKLVAVAHTVSDFARIVFPVAGTLANAALVGVSLAIQHQYHLKLVEKAKEARARHLDPDPPPAV
ncbi:MAG: hypothetical protein ACAI38_25865 [Myxococcota bacterium]